MASKSLSKNNRVSKFSKGKFTQRLNLTHLLVTSMSMKARVIFSNLRYHFGVSWGERFHLLEVYCGEILEQKKNKNRQTKT